LRRADLIVLSRADAVDEQARNALRAEVQRFAPDAGWLEVAHQPEELLGAGENRLPIEWLRGKRVAAFCGIGNPGGFRHTLQDCGCQLAGFQELPDHHPYEQRNVEQLAEWAAGLNAVDAAICTHKDLVKIDRSHLGPLPLWALSIGLAIRVGREPLERQLQRLLQPKA
jgi:tetraacyldisaccharide 4'-kinase